MWHESSNSYASSSSSSSQNAYYPQPVHQDTQLQFYDSSDATSFYTGSRPSLDGNVASQGSISQQAYGGSIQPIGGWWTAFGTGGFEGEPPLLEELGINFQHIRAKSLTVLNPLRGVDARIMDDADMAGPIIFVFCFGICLLFVRMTRITIIYSSYPPQSGKPNFGYIYGVGLFGSAAMYTLLNLMSERGVSAISVMMVLDGTFGYLLSILSILWCTYSASGIFVAVLQMSDQRLLVAYPVGLLYGCFALLSVFNNGSSGGIS
ncbi:hypothetical protein C0991_005610 [Blastosporella zonata]|nr:hypothetical protein C0991_005610 [Blastosporella zonata]